MVKALFLDHDGVIKPYGFESKIRFFDPSCIKILNEIISITDCELVVSSDWRLHYSLKNLSEIYEDEGIYKIPISVTPDFYRSRSSVLAKQSSLNALESIRAVEILRWLDSFGEKFHISKWCAVDDMKLPIVNFVYCDPNEGLLQVGVKEKIIKFLNGDKFLNNK